MGAVVNGTWYSNDELMEMTNLELFGERNPSAETIREAAIRDGQQMCRDSLTGVDEEQSDWDEDDDDDGSIRASFA